MFRFLIQQLPWSSARRKADAQFARLLHEHGLGLRRVVRGYFPHSNPTQREDIEQEIALALWRALPNFRGECSERTFVFRIAHNRCITHRSRRTVTIDDAVTLDTLHDTTPTAEHSAAQRQAYNRLHAAVATLPIKYRQVVMLSLEGMTHPEISEVLGISPSNVAVRLHRAQPMLRSRLSKEDAQ